MKHNRDWGVFGGRNTQKETPSHQVRDTPCDAPFNTEKANETLVQVTSSCQNRTLRKSRNKEGRNAITWSRDEWRVSERKWRWTKRKFSMGPQGAQWESVSGCLQVIKTTGRMAPRGFIWGASSKSLVFLPPSAHGTETKFSEAIAWPNAHETVLLMATHIWFPHSLTS